MAPSSSPLTLEHAGSARAIKWIALGLHLMSVVEHIQAVDAAQRSLTAVQSAEPKMRRVLVDLPELPEPFSNDKLPAQLANATHCYTFLGCFEPVPVTSLGQAPEDIHTEFLIYGQNGLETLVKFEPVVNCLSAKPSQCNVYPLDLAMLSSAPYKKASRTIILVSGYLTKAPCDWESRVRDLWLELDDVNLIIVNWVGGNSGAYHTAARNTRPVSRQLVVLLYHLAQMTGLELADDSFAEKIYITGHSLGAHIAGFVGLDLAGGLGRITGLDPAGPIFDELDARFRLDRSDARLVDALHSNAGAELLSSAPKYGSALASGHLDLYANDGRHQPGCSQDFLGCSHGKSNKYYAAYLQHELSARQYLKDKYCSLYRLSAYSAEMFALFRNGTSLTRRCPKTSVELDAQSADLEQCSVPIDYFSWYDQVREELITRHGIDFSPNAAGNNSYFFMTSHETDDQMDHYLVQARVAKKLGGGGETRPLLKPVRRLQSWRASSAAPAAPSRGPDQCDIELTIRMDKGLERKVRLEQYQLIEAPDHYKIVAPYLSTSLISKYQLAKLDSEDYYVESSAVERGLTWISNITRLRKSLTEIFPSTINIKGIYLDDEMLERRRQEREHPGIMDSILGIFGMAHQGDVFADDWEPTPGESDISHMKASDSSSCNITLESLVVRPLRRLHRSLVAVYTSKAHMDTNQTYPKVVVLGTSSSPVSIESLANEAAQNFTNNAGRAAAPTGPNTHLQLNTVIIGPFDRALVGESQLELYLDDILPAGRNSYTLEISSAVTPATWIALTALLLVAMVLLALATSVRVRYQDTERAKLKAGLMQLNTMLAAPADQSAYTKS